MDLTIALAIIAAIHIILGIVCGIQCIISFLKDDRTKDDIAMYLFFSTYGFVIFKLIYQAITVINTLLP